MLQFQLIIALKLFFCIATLQVDLNFNLPGMCHFLLLSIGVLRVGSVLIFLLVKKCLLLLLRCEFFLLCLHDDSLLKRDGSSELEVLCQQKLSHRNLTVNIQVVEHHLNM